MKELKVKWTGMRPLIMSNPQVVELSNAYSITARRLNSEMKAARKKGNEDRMMELEQEIKRNDWEASAYYDNKEHRFYLPDMSILACIRAGAMMDKRGKDIETAVIIAESEIAIQTVSHRNLDAYYKDEKFRLSCAAKVPPKTGALIWKTRCMIPTGWVAEFTIEFEESLIAEKTIQTAMFNAGTLKGVGGWRPRFGRFLVET